MKKWISVLMTCVVIAVLAVSAFAAEFVPYLTVDRSVEGVILVSVADDDATNEVLAEKTPSLTIPCNWDSAKLLGGGEDTTLTVTKGKITFTVTHGGTYLITNQEYSVDLARPGCMEDGKYTYHIGENTYEEAIPATGHDFTNPFRRTCANCGAPNPYYVPVYTPPTSQEPEKEPENVLEPVNPFVDITEENYYYDAVLWAVSEGIASGVTDRTFAPMEACTRAQVVTFLWRAAGSPEPVGADHTFADVEAGSCYEKAVQWAVENGITTGTTATTFSPEMAVTRAQAVTFLWRAAGCPAYSGESGFYDVEPGSYYADAVQWAVENGITTGTEDHLFSPGTSCARAQVVTFLYRCCAV